MLNHILISVGNRSYGAQFYVIQDQYDSTQSPPRNNIALLALNDRAPISGSQLAALPADNSNNLAGTTANTSGYAGCGQPGSALLQGSGVVLTTDQCNNQIGGGAQDNHLCLNSGTLCASEPGAAVMERINGVNTLVGVQGPCGSGPLVAARTSSFLSWIQLNSF
jgi:hypothetical protein